MRVITAYLGRGVIAGLLAGLLAGLFTFFFGEPLVADAIQLEEAASGHGHGEEAAGGHGAEEPIVSRSVQGGVGLFAATALSGALLGGLFGIAYAYFRGRLASNSEWYRSISLAGAVFVGAILIPFLKYPANPPTVGDPATIGTRITLYFAMIALSLLVVLGAWYAAKKLRERGMGDLLRQLVVGLGAVVAFGILFLVLPAAPGTDPGEFPAGLLWDFRLASLGTQLVLWAGLGVIFGLLCERANRREPSTRS